MSTCHNDNKVTICYKCDHVFGVWKMCVTYKIVQKKLIKLLYLVPILYYIHTLQGIGNERMWVKTRLSIQTRINKSHISKLL